MNHIYRLVWSQVRRAWLVVSELARGRGKAGRTTTPRRTRSAWWIALPLSLPMLALAAAPTVIAPVASSTHPTGGQVTAGSGRIDYGDHLTTIQQDSQNVSLNWQSFNVGADSTVNFVQPSAKSIAVNRIADANGSVILGHLNANGQVFLLNPNGVLFGEGAQVNVGGLVASTLDLSDSELGRGTLHFGGAGGGSVTNRGTITAAPGGYVALLGHSVSNQGAIHAPAGSVALAGGSAVTLSFDGNRLLDMRVDASTLNALAENKQLIVAAGGQVLMSAGAKNALLASVVNNTGTIQAQTVANRAGKIVLLGGMEAGTTQVAGTLDASAPDGGDGGFIETSAAHVQVADGAKITTLAAAGNTGTWLIDPHDFTIAASGGDMSGGTLSSQLRGGNVTIESSRGSNASGSGDIHVNDAVNWSANTLTLTAAHTIDISAVMTASGSAGLALNPITANGADAVVGGGTINVNVVDVMPGQSGRVDFTGSSNTLSINGQPYTIITALGAAGSTTKTDLQGINGNLQGYYALGTNIDASATASWHDGAGFEPIKNYGLGEHFTGIFEGLGHTISGLTINRPREDQIGLFGFVNFGGAIRNVGLLGASVTGQYRVGGLVGFNRGTISQAYAIGAISSGSGSGGGLVGTNEMSISQAYASGAVSSGGYNVGGLVGYNNTGTISHAYATSAVSGSGWVGGLVGRNYGGNISQAYATGTVSGSDWVGGLVGMNEIGRIGQAFATGAVSGVTEVGGLIGRSENSTISQVYATGAAYGTSKYVGGLVGLNTASNISQAYATGAVGGGATWVGGLAGYSGGGITDSYWNTETTGLATSDGGGTGLTTAALIAALPGGFTTAAWGNSDNQTTPYLLGMSGNQVFNKDDLPGTVTRANRPKLYTVILDVNQLQAVAADLAGRYVLGNDIDGSATVNWNSGAGFTPIGTGPGITAFTGIFDGFGHTISGLTINRPNANYIGLFGIIGTGSAIHNLGLLGGAVTGKGYVGGLVGYNDSGTISQAYATSAVSGSPAGGLVGYNRGTINQAYAAGAVSGIGIVGGLVGYSAGNSTINQAYATGAVSGSIFYVGGLVGYNYSGTISQAYASGAVSGTNSDIGGLVGSNGGTVKDSYWNTQTTGQSTSDGGTGLTTAQMMAPASFAGWDIAAASGTSVWRIYAGNTAPRLSALITSPVVGGVGGVGVGGVGGGGGVGGVGVGVGGGGIGGGQDFNDNASTVVTTIVAGLQQDELAADNGAATLHAPDIRIVGTGVRLP